MSALLAGVLLNLAKALVDPDEEIPEQGPQPQKYVRPEPFANLPPRKREACRHALKEIKKEERSWLKKTMKTFIGMFIKNF